MTIVAPFPKPLMALFEPKRYKVLWGGRGAGRSWGVARALLLIGAEKPIRVLCAREFQHSIAESVHKTLSDQIVALGLESHYDIQVAKIIGKNGTTFSFEGLKNNVSKIKSYEGLDYCWVEEAVKVSQNSWQVLIPTIRKPNSEIWLTFNPELESDYTYRRFVLEAGEDSWVMKMTWKDNPWFPQVLRDEMEKLRKLDYDAYMNVWEGFPVRMLEGVVYAKELRRAEEDGRICRVPWERDVAVDTFWDLGKADGTGIWGAQKVSMQYRLLFYFEAVGEDIPYFLKELQGRQYVYGTHFLPWDAKHKRLGMPRSIEEIIARYGRKQIVRKLPVNDGHNAARMLFPNCWFDIDECADGLNALRHYRYEVHDGQYSLTPKHDWAMRGADAFRTFAVGVRDPQPESDFPTRMKSVVGRMAEAVPGLGWMS